jgi:hypothetical protein
MNNHTILLDIRRDMQAGQGGSDNRAQPVSTTSILPATTRH